MATRGAMPGLSMPGMQTAAPRPAAVARPGVPIGGALPARKKPAVVGGLGLPMSPAGAAPASRDPTLNSVAKRAMPALPGAAALGAIPQPPMPQLGGGIPGAAAGAKAMGGGMPPPGPQIPGAGGGRTPFPMQPQMPGATPATGAVQAKLQSMLGAAGGAEHPGAASDTPEDDYWTHASDEYEAIMADDAAAWAGQQGTLQGEMAGFQRSADSMNARMGGGIGGGSAGLAGAALGQGMQAYNSAAQDYANRRRATQLAWLDKQVEHGQRQEEHGWSEADQQTARDHEMRMWLAEQSGELPSTEAMATAGEQGTGTASAAREKYYGDAVHSYSGANADQVKKLYEQWLVTNDSALLQQMQGLMGGDAFQNYGDWRDTAVQGGGGTYDLMHQQGMSDDDYANWYYENMA